MQGYDIPSNISKIKNNTITVGQLQFVPAPIQTRTEWDMINFLPYTSDIPNYYFIYNGQVLFWPIPSTTGNIITFNYKSRVPELSIADYSTGTIAAAGMVVGSNAVIGSGTTWGSVFPLNTDITFLNLMIKADIPNGDGICYLIQSFQDNTHLTTLYPIQNAPNIAGATYTIGQYPLLSEDFHDMMVYGALKIYFSSISKDVDKFKTFDAEWKLRKTMLEDYAGTKSVNVDLGASPAIVNPNLFIYAP